MMYEVYGRTPDSNRFKSIKAADTKREAALKFLQRVTGMDRDLNESVDRYRSRVESSTGWVVEEVVPR